MAAAEHDIHRSGSSLSSDDGTQRRRHGPPGHPTAQRSRSISPVLEADASDADADASDEDGVHGSIRRSVATAAESVLPGSRPAGDGRSRYSALRSTDVTAAFDGVEAEGGSGSIDISGGRGGRASSALRRRLPGIASFWDGITPELVAVSMGALLCTLPRMCCAVLPPMLPLP